MPVESLIIIFLALALGSLVKGIAGLGLPLVAIPVMSTFMAVDHAVAVMVIPGIMINTWLLWTYRKHAVKIADLPAMIGVGILTVALGAWILSEVPDTYLITFMVFWVGGYLISLLFKERLKSGLTFGRHGPLVVVGLAGVIQGSNGTSGPVFAPYVHSLKLTQPQYVYVVSVIFQIFAITQLVSFGWLGMIDMERGYHSLLACIPIAIFLPLAVWLARFFSDRAFNIIIVVVLIAIEIRLIWRLAI
ncbi:MAG: sulfite exporter TauE/SafE family protein [Rhodospirillaceae bacterium]|nr:sulfite exporter TauE/SafE family protein [Rhodospirillaceae bacterium]